MNDLISRKAAIDIVVFECGKWTGLAKEISKQLKRLPSAQPEIIRCKDCRWFDSEINQCDRQICAVFYDDDFCSYAERKADE